MSASEALRERCLNNLTRVREGVADACRRAGRMPTDVTLVGVTKYVDAAAARVLLEVGCADLAESRPQDLWAKAAALADAEPPPRWHLVGHLQRNKVRRTLPVGALIHTLDSRRLLVAFDAEAAAADTSCEVLVEVNVSGDPARSVLYYRIAKLGRGRMPHFGSDVVDPVGLKMVGDWIAGLSAAPAADAPAPAAAAADSAPVTADDLSAAGIGKSLDSTAGAVALVRSQPKFCLVEQLLLQFCKNNTTW
jgi:hypothetical protein